MRGLKRQTGGADGRSNAVAQRKKRTGSGNARTKTADRGVLTDEATRLAAGETRRAQKCED